MNNKRRDLLKLAVQLLERASGYVSQALDAEQDCLDNMPENLQSSERYEKMEADGIISPVLSVSCQYKTMVRFDDQVVIRLGILSYNGIKLCISYEVRDRESGEIRCIGESSHCFLGKDGKPVSLKRQYPEYHKILQQCALEFHTEK